MVVVRPIDFGKKNFSFFLEIGLVTQLMWVSPSSYLLLALEVIFVLRVCFLSILFYVLICFPSLFRLTLSFGNAAVIHPRLEKVYLDRIDEVRAFPGRTFHDLVTLSRLAAWGLGPLPTVENLSHEETTRRSKCRPHHFACLFFFFDWFSSSQG